MVRIFLILFLILITGCTITIDKKAGKRYNVDIPYYLHFKNKSHSEISTIKIINITIAGESVIFETTSEQFEERMQRGKFVITGQYCLVVTSLKRKPLTETRNYFTIEGHEKRIGLDLDIQSFP